MSGDLTIIQCPACKAPIEGPGTCAYCGAEVRRAEVATPGRSADLRAAGIPTWIKEARERLAAGKKIQAIVCVRHNHPMGLKEAKGFVEEDLLDDGRVKAVLAGAPPTPPKPTIYDQPHVNSGGGSSCFPATARVDTPSGPRPIGELERGDEVWAWSATQGRRIRARVTRRVDHPPQPLWRLDLEGRGAPLTTTRNHSLLTHRGWLRADRVRPGDRLPTPGNGADRVVIRGGDAGAREPVHNLHTTGPHTFVVEGVVAHNFTVLRTARTLWHRLWVDPRIPEPARQGLGEPEPASA